MRAAHARLPEAQCATAASRLEGHATGCAAGGVLGAAYNMLTLLVCAQHGELQALAAGVLHKLAPTVLGQAQVQGQGKRGGGGGGPDRRSAALDWIKALYE